jgi:geranylgeranyl diphosphate synthase type I
MSHLALEIAECAQKVNRFIEKIVDKNSKPNLLYKASRQIIDAGGKRLRPFLVLKSFNLVKGKEEGAIPTAAALELLHTFTLIHDDIMDQDNKRRGVPTVHTQWGLPIAIVAGDLLFAKVYEAIIKYTDNKIVTPKRILEVLRDVTEATIQLCEGQTRDMMFEEKEAITEEEYLEMINGKTAALFKTAARSGGILGGANKKQVESLGMFGHFSGMAFQIIDDILALTADEKVLKKPVGNDIREGKRTLMIVYALEKASKDERKRILKTLGNKDASPEQIRKTIDLINSLGAINHARGLAKKYIEKSKEALAIFPESKDKEDLINLSHFIFSRQH